MNVRMQFRFIPPNTGCGMECRTGSRVVQDLTNKQKGKSYMCIWIFLFSPSRVLLCLKALVVIGFTVFALYEEVGKGFHRL